MKKAIAMRCTQEQFDAVEPNLNKNNLYIHKIDSFITHPYLVNNLHGEKGIISNACEKYKKDFNREVYEEWNEKVFLEACDIEIFHVSPTRDQIIDHFASAKTVKIYGCESAIDNFDKHSLYFDISESSWMLIHKTNHRHRLVLFDKKEGFAEITSHYKLDIKIPRSTRISKLEKRMEVLENRVDIIKIANMPDNNDLKTSIPNYSKGISSKPNQKFIVDDNEFYKVISGGCGSMGANNEIVQIVELKSKPDNYSGAYWQGEKHNAKMFVKTIAGNFWGLCEGFKLNKASDTEIINAKTEYTKKMLTKEIAFNFGSFGIPDSHNDILSPNVEIKISDKLKEDLKNNAVKLGFALDSGYVKYATDVFDSFKMSFNSINTDPKAEVNKLKLRIEELEAENHAILAGDNSKSININGQYFSQEQFKAISKALSLHEEEIDGLKKANDKLIANIDFWQKECSSMQNFIQGIKNQSHNFLGMK